MLQCGLWVILPQHFGSMQPNVTTAFCGSGTLGVEGVAIPMSRCFECHSRSVSQARQAVHEGTFCRGSTSLVWDVAASTLAPCYPKSAASGRDFSSFHLYFSMPFFFFFFFRRNHLHLSLIR